ncbi:MAG: hypothetical protein ACI93S_000401 [Ancylomarina sp.]|jgi:hypothetical protein
MLIIELSSIKMVGCCVTNKSTKGDSIGDDIRLQIKKYNAEDLDSLSYFDRKHKTSSVL